MSLDPIALAAQIAHNLAQLQEAGFVDQSRVNDLLEVLPVPGKANWCVYTISRTARQATRADNICWSL